MSNIANLIQEEFLNLNDRMKETTELYLKLARYCTELIQNAYGEKKLEFPVNLELIADYVGIKIESDGLNDERNGEFSRILSRLIENDKGQIIIIVDNQVGAKTQRYATAHALARYLLRGDAAILEGTYAIPLIPQSLDEIMADVVALFLLLPPELFKIEFKNYLVQMIENEKPIDVDVWLDYLSNKSMVSLFNLSIGYQQLKQVLSYEKQKQFEAIGFDIDKMVEDEYDIVYA